MSDDTTDPGCERCGSSSTWEECYECCGDGEYSIDGDDGVEETYACDICLGKGGWRMCMSNPEWCASHPLPGKEADAG